MGRSRRVIRWKTDCLQTSRRIYFFSNNPNPPSQISPLAPSFIRHRLPWSTLLVLKPLRALQGGESPVWGSPWWDVPSQMTEPGKGHPACPLAVLVVVSFRDQDLLPCKGPTQPRAPAPAARTSPAPCSSGQSWEGSFWENGGRKPARLKISPSPAPSWALPSCCMFWCSEWCCEGIQGDDPPPAAPSWGPWPRQAEQGCSFHGSRPSFSSHSDIH